MTVQEIVNAFILHKQNMQVMVLDADGNVEPIRNVDVVLENVDSIEKIVLLTP